MIIVTESFLLARHWASLYLHYPNSNPLQPPDVSAVIIQKHYHLLHEVASRGQHSLALSPIVSSATLNIVTKKSML